jgi:hypothetical protein
MAKRFTDTDLWDKDWFMKLNCKEKCLIRFIFDKCDVAGVWTPNWVLASTYIGEKVTPDDLKNFAYRLTFIDSNKIFIPDFVEFQYGKLSEKCKPHLKVIATLKKYGLFKDDSIGYTYPLQRVEEEEEDKEGEKNVLKGVQGEKGWNTMPTENDVTDLPELKIGSAQQLMKITRQVDVSVTKIIGMWEVFKVQNLTGTKYYQDVGAVHTHFINWIKTQKFETAKPSEINHGTNVNDRLKNITKASAA